MAIKNDKVLLLQQTATCASQIIFSMRQLLKPSIFAKAAPILLLLRTYYSGADAMVATATTSKKIFCFGDSLTAGSSPPSLVEHPYAPHLEQTLKSLQGFESCLVRWKGYPGWTSADLLAEGGLEGILDNIKSKAGPLDLLIVLAGTNDLAYATENDADKIFNSIVDIHKVAHLNGCKRTIALGIPPSGWQMQSSSARKLADSVNGKLESWATKILHSDDDDGGGTQSEELKEFEEGSGNENGRGTVAFVPFPIETFDASSGLWAPDGLHFSPEGYETIGKSLASHVMNVLE